MNIDVEQVIREYLPEVVHMSLATSKDNRPWVCEVHFAYDDGLNLYFRSTPARRHSQNIVENPYVAGNIVKQVGLGEPCSGEVCFEGTAELVKYDSPEFDTVSQIFDARLSIGAEKIQEAKNPEGNQFYKISVTNFAVFGNFDGQGSKKYELVWNSGE